MTFKQLLLTTVVMLGLMLTTMAQSIYYVDTCNIPVLSLPFNGSAIDVSGNNNNGILGGGSIPFYTTDRFGNNNSAIQLGGCGNLNWVKVPNSPTLKFNNYRYSASLWFKQCDFAGMDGWGNCVPSGGLKVIYAKAGDYCAANPSIYCFSTISATNTINVGHVNKLFSCGSGSINNPGNYSINNIMSCYDACEWIHLVNVVDSNVLKMYINGQLVQQQFIAAPDFSIANNQDLYFGRMFPGNWYPYGGTIDDVNFYNCAINQTTIDSLYGGYSNPLQGMAVASANNDSICISQSLQLFADTMNNATYTWTGPNGFTSTQQNPTINNFQSNLVGSYYLKVSIAGCGNSFDTIQIFQGNCNVDTCKTTQISLNTGVDANGNLLPIGSQDQLWKVVNLINNFPPAGNSLPYSPYVIQPFFCCWPTNFTNSQFINSNTTYLENGGTLSTDAYHQISRNFTTLMADSFLYHSTHFGDEYIYSIKIDGVEYNSNLNQLATTTIDTTIYLTAGCHNILYSWNNYYSLGWSVYNPTAIIVEGYIKSLHNDSTILRQNCVTNTPPTLTANDTINYCANCEPVSPNLTITSGLGCGNLDTVKVYFTTGYTQGQDTLQFIPQLGINSSFNASTGILKLYGNANYGVWETVLRTVCYRSLVANNSNNNAVKNVVISLGNALYNPANGHYYKLVNNASALSWHAAKNAAAATNYYGLQGYLVTITSAQENNFITSLIQSSTWIGASDNAVEGTWRWVTGCEGLEDGGQGRYFSNYSAPVNGNFTNWALTPPCYEPNNCCGGEDYLHLISSNTTLCGNLGEWNDFPDNGYIQYLVNSYIIEYGCMPNDPIINLAGNITINLLAKKDTIINQTICQGSSFLGYNITGIYIDTFATASGCDSIRTLNLIVNNCNSCATNQILLNTGYNSSTNSLLPNGSQDSIWQLTSIQNSYIELGYALPYNPFVTPGVGYYSSTNAKFLTHSTTNCQTGQLPMGPLDSKYRISRKFVTSIADTFLINANFAVDNYIDSFSIDGVKYFSSLPTAQTWTFTNLNLALSNLTIWLPAGCHEITCDYADWNSNTVTNQGCSGIYIEGTIQSLHNFNSIIKDSCNSNFITSIKDTICQGQSYLGYNTTGVYVDTFVSVYGCDSVRILSLTVNSTQAFTINQTICQPNSYLGYNASGTYIDTFQNQFGCDSIRTLNLIVKPMSYSTLSQTICQGQSYLGYATSGIFHDTLLNSQGCDSIRTLNLIVRPMSYSSLSQTICQPNSYLGYNTTGTYIDTFQNQYGCDSIRTLNLIANPTQAFITNQTICQPNSYLGYSASGTFIDTFQNQYGCDSIRTLNLIVKPMSYSTLSQTICQPNSYLGYSVSGTFIDTFQNQYGCDSIRTLNLIVKPMSYSSLSQTICQPNSYLGYNTTGTYIDIFQNQYGCDSIRTLNLIANPTQAFTINQTICQPNSYLGYNTSGTYIDTFQNQFGCDSIRTLNLIVKPMSYSTLSQTICQPNSYLGYNITGTFLDTFINANGCDSVRTINLIVNVPTVSIIIDTICAGQNTFGYTANGIYVDYFINSKGCDSTRTLELFVKQNSSFTYNHVMCSGETYLGHSSSGTYIDVLTNSLGCDSIHTLNVIVHPNYLIDTSITLCNGDSLFVGNAWQFANGIYLDTFTSIYGCDSIKKTTLQFRNKLYPIILGDTTFCQGDSVLLYVKNFKHYLWNTGDTTDRITVYNSGQYIVSVSNNQYCFGKDTVNVDMNLLPNVSLSFTNRELCKYDTIQLSANGALNYYWYTPDMNRFIGSQNPINYSIERTPITVYLKGIDDNNCVNYDSVTLYYVNCCGSIFVPNAFSPNGDGKNDAFKPTFNQVKFDKYIFQVFNRFGQKIFETNNMNESWDGRVKGASCDIGTYYYLIKTNCFESQEDKIISGDINLLR